MRLVAGLTGIISLVSARVVPSDYVANGLHSIGKRTPATPDGACTNGPLTRSCWSSGYSIATDFDQRSPRTGATVNYDLTITNSTCNPDGYGDRVCFLINGQYPGPVIEANWGGTVVVRVNNQLSDNGTAMHFHGVRQLSSCGADGVAGITQCPIAPGQSHTYEFIATQFGTSWYHSHWSNQYGDGLPTAFQVAYNSKVNLQSTGGPPTPDNLLINGTNKNAQAGGKYNYVTITKGKKYRLRLINMSVDNYIRVSLDNHPLTVMTSDYVPIRPFTTEWLLLGIGQRYDVVINANQTAGNYWFRADVSTECLSANALNGRAVWSYTGATVADPTTNAFTVPSSCIQPTAMAPFWNQPVPSGSFAGMAQRLSVNITKAQVVPGGDTVVVWALNSTSLNVDWSYPTMSYLFDSNTSYAPAMHVLPTTSEGSWNYWLIQQADGTPPVPHPIHLHGHDFFVLGQGDTKYDGTQTLNWETPIRRDTATVYGGGWLALAFRSDNPGAWLMHCHIAWHISEGLGMQFLEEPSKIKMPEQPAYDNLCSSWRAYTDGMLYAKDDSGL